MISNFQTEGDKFYIPENLLKRIHAQLKIIVSEERNGISYDSIGTYLKRYYESFLIIDNEALYYQCLETGIGVSAANIERAIKGKKGAARANIDFEVQYDLLNFLCYVCWKSTLIAMVGISDIDWGMKTLYQVIIQEKDKIEIQTLISSRLLEQKKILENPNSQEAVKSKEEKIVNNIKLEGIDKLNEDYWSLLTQLNEKNKIDLLNRYYTHIDSKLIPKAVANERYIIEPQELFYITDNENNKEQKTFNQAIEQATSDSFSLIKILGEGGIGKSTFLHWIGKHYFSKYDIFLIKRLYSNTGDILTLALSEIAEENSKPIIFLIDDIAEYEKSRQISDFVIKIKENLSTSFQIVFIVAERKARFNSQFGLRKLDIHFSGSIQCIDYLPANKNEIFLRIYSIFSETNFQLSDQTIQKSAENIFLDAKIHSISESIFRLLIFLKYKSNITYEFDWDDWDDFIKTNPEFQSLENLFIAVTCFYQFGIQTPITFSCPSLNNINRVKIRKAINSFGVDESPIRLTDDSQEDDTKLYLKHEYVATWFLYDESRKKLVIDFFKDFLSSINSKESGWLLRQFRKLFKSKEYLNSGFSEFLNEEKYVSLIDSYVKISTIPEVEKVKMQMEKGIILLQQGKRDEAKAIFQSIADKDIFNNHARDQLARIYLSSTSTYQLAFDKYLEISKNGGLYAIIQIYKLLRLSKKENIHINYESNSDFTAKHISAIADKLSPYEYHEIIKEFILNDEPDFAEILLLKVENPQNITAECFNFLANSIKYSNESIERKENHYLKAIDLDKQLNGSNENFQFVIDYALFLYRIRSFPESLAIIKSLIAQTDENSKKHIENKYWNSVRFTKKLFFKDKPSKENLTGLEIYLLKQCTEAAALISFKQKNIDNIIKGFLILQTVRYHSKISLPDVFNNASKLMAYCYMQNSNRQWNNLLVRENRLIAEKLYDQLLEVGYFLDKNDCTYLLKNLLNFEEKEKTAKALVLTNRILIEHENRKFPVFYRYRGNAKKHLEDYNGAMVDYQTALERCKPINFENERDYKNDKSYLLNNIALLICDCIEVGKPSKKYSLQDALIYCRKSIELRPDLRILEETKIRIENLIKSPPLINPLQ
jgi:hypothetical protein